MPMVRLRRGPPPARLVTRGDIWTKRWQAIHTGQRRGDWATERAKETLAEGLRQMTYEKCAFCESLLGVTSYLEIEHYTAKTVRAEESFDWLNLFPICRLCNNAKGSTDHAGALIKPDIEDPEEMLWLHPDTGKLEPKTGLGRAAEQRVQTTIELCDLQRGALCTKRIDAMPRTIRWLQRLSNRGGQLDAILNEEWNDLINPAAEYKFVIRHIFETKGEPRLAARDRVGF